MTGTRRTYLSQAQLERVRSWWKHYAWAVGRVGLPAEWCFAIAGVHYRESGLRGDAPGEPGGPFCVDPEGDGDQLARIQAHAASVCAKFGHVAKDLSLETDFCTASLVAASDLRGKARRPIGRTEQDLALALGRYNGFPRYYSEAWQTGSGDPAPAVRWHPYVANDPLNGRQLYRAGSILTPDGTSVELRRAPDANPGAMIVALELRERWREWFQAGDELGGGPCA